MNAVHYIKLLLRHGKWLLAVPVLCAATVFYLTKNAKQKYFSSTVLYTGVASGYSITSTEDERLDYFAVNNAFDNLVASAKSRETIEEVGLRLLAEHLLLTKPDPQVLGPEGFMALRKLASPQLVTKARAIGNAEDVFTYLHAIFTSKANNDVAQLLSKPGSFYNVDDLKSGLTITRLNTSDMLQVDYSCSDPAVCQRVLELHTQIFNAGYHRLKSDQTASAVEYFERKLAEVRGNLTNSEDDLKKFGQDNRIINYYEQTRYIAQSKEELEKEIYAQKMIQNGCKNALTLIQKKLNDREKQILNSASIMRLREQLSKVNTEEERARLFNDGAKAGNLAGREKQLQDSIKAASNQYMTLNYSLETVPRTSLLDQWVENAVALDKSTAGLAVLENQRQIYLGEIDQMAPLGSSLKRLDRQVDINEQEFLSILHGLNLAKLRQSNLSLSSNIVIQDKPFFPLKPEKSTRMLLVIVAFLAGFITVGAVVIARELMDSSLRSPERAKKIIGLPLAGITAAGGLNKFAGDHGKLRTLLGEQMLHTLLPYLNNAGGQNTAILISIISLRNNGFRAGDIKQFHINLSQLFKRIFWVVPGRFDKTFAGALPVESVAFYQPMLNHLNAKTPCEIARLDLSHYDLVIYVSPCLSENSVPAAMVKQAAVNLVTIGATETWQVADKENIEKITAAADGAPLYTWLVNTEETNLESVVGEIPKQRSWIRKKIKKLITLNLR